MYNNSVSSHLLHKKGKTVNAVDGLSVMPQFSGIPSMFAKLTSDADVM